jgi:hypothetical protein
MAMALGTFSHRDRGRDGPERRRTAAVAGVGRLPTGGVSRPSADYFPEKQFKSDTTLFGPNTTATVFMKFRTFEGPFVFHCHILQHEDSMMMFNFDPNRDGAAYRAGDPIPTDRNFTPYPYPSAHNSGVLVTAPPAGTTAHAHGDVSSIQATDGAPVHTADPLVPFDVAYHPGLHPHTPDQDGLLAGYEAAAGSWSGHEHGGEFLIPYDTAYHLAIHSTLAQEDSLLPVLTLPLPVSRVSKTRASHHLPLIPMVDPMPLHRRMTASRPGTALRSTVQPPLG